MKKALFFDLDGTLVNTLPLYIQSYRQTLNSFNISLTDKQIVDECFGKTEDIICNKLGIPEKTSEFSKLYFDSVMKHYQKGKLFDGILELLQISKKSDIELAVISFAYQWYVDSMIESLGIRDYFELIISHDNVSMPKPDPEAALTACNKLKVDPALVYVIGDSKSDILMGKAAHCKTALFYPKGYELFYELDVLKQASPDYIITNINQLKDIVGF